MTSNSWLDQLHFLLERFSYLGISEDLASMDLIELWGVYHYLRRLAEG